MHLSSATYAYPELDGSARAHVARSLGSAGLGPGVFVLSTCLRVEVVAPSDESTLAGMVAALPGARLRSGPVAAEHLFRVAAGLESPVLGEPEVLTQFRQAVAALKLGGPVEGPFLRLLESAIATGRSSRELIGTAPHDTMAAIAAQIVGGAGEVAVIGSGTMAQAVLAALGALPAPPAVTIVARSPDRLGPRGEAHLPLEQLDDLLSTVPAAVSATAASTRLLDGDRLQAVLSRRTRPLTLVDMAMPPDFDPPAAAGVAYVGIDDIARLAARRGEAEEVTAHVAAAAADAHHHYTNQSISGPVIRSIIESAEAAVAETVARFTGRLTDPADAEVLAQAVHTVARKLVDRPVTAVRASRDPRLVEVLSAMFDDD